MPDLNDLPGVRALRERTQGDRRVLVAVIDGQPEVEHPTFEGADVESIRGYWLDDQDPEEWSTAHATHIASVIFGQPGSSVPGLAPDCRGMLITAGINEEWAESEIGVARAIEFALAKGAQIIHCAFCHPSQTGKAQSWMLDAVKKAAKAGAVIVAPAGNDYGENWCVPSSLPEVLAVGALADDGAPMPFTNFGELYSGHSIMGPGENVLGAEVGGGVVQQKGTSVAAPVLTGLIAALTSAVVQAGQAIQPQRVRDVLIATARPCTGSGADRCIGGVVAVDRALAVLLDGMTIEESRIAFPDGPPAPDAPAALAVPPKGEHHPLPPHSHARHYVHEPVDTRGVYKGDAEAVTASAVEPAIRYPTIFFGIGAVDYDFPDDNIRDSFTELMHSRMGLGDVEDRVAVVAYLDEYPAEARRLLWTFSMNGEPRYWLDPVGAYGAQVYDMLAALVLGRVRGEVTVASIPGWTFDVIRNTRAGDPLRQVRVNSLRGIYGWDADVVARQSLAAVNRDAQAGGVGRAQVESQVVEPAIARDDADNVVFGLRESSVVTWPRLSLEPTTEIQAAVIDFLNHVYFRSHQQPEVSRDRAINFAATNGYQVAAAFLDAMHAGLQFQSYRTEYSPFARVSGNCWDIILRFNDPKSSRRAPVEYRVTVDIADLMPVTVGRLRRWAT